MKNLNIIIGNKLKDVRLKKNLSLDNVSKLTGVSKGMLGQIERGLSNPTVSTLWKISTGLKVSFSSFINEENDTLKIIHKSDIVPLKEEGSKMKLYPVFPFDANSGFEIFTIELEPGCNHLSEPHNDDIEEYILISEGSMTMNIDNKQFIMKSGDCLKFKGNTQHSYINNTSRKVVFQNIIMYYK